MSNKKVAILVPAYKRPEYTLACIKALKEAQEYQDTIFCLWNDDGTDDTQLIFDSFKPRGENNHILHPRSEQGDPYGLRAIIRAFFVDPVLAWPGIQFMSKVDNDCVVPKNWLNDILRVFDTTDVDILSPNVFPSNAAYKYGLEDTEGKGYRPAKTVGGVWTMKVDMIRNVDFLPIKTKGIVGAWPLLKQIVIEKKAKVGWTDKVTFQDIGHWSGDHPEHIKSKEHELYSVEVGRPIGWKT